MEDFVLSEFLDNFLTSPSREGGGALVSCYKCRDEGMMCDSCELCEGV